MKRISVFFLTLFMLIISFCLFTGCGNRDRDGEEAEYWKEKADEAEKEREEAEAELENGYLQWKYENLKGSK